MTYLIIQMLLCLLAAAVLGFIIGWALRGASCQKKIAELEAEWADRLAAAGSGGGPAQKDDLKKIEGIGPRIEKMLNDDQIFTWAQLADAEVPRLKDLLRRGGDRYRMHDPKTWPDQAKLAAEGRWEELKEYQDVLQGGRDH
jgi:predicted flap endonuclease-1-like 5' DNA nuclease